LMPNRNIRQAIRWTSSTTRETHRALCSIVGSSTLFLQFSSAPQSPPSHHEVPIADVVPGVTALGEDQKSESASGEVCGQRGLGPLSRLLDGGYCIAATASQRRFCFSKSPQRHKICVSAHNTA